ncbi:MAG TPA: glycyl-radical enzyme activating protein [Bacillota bacterium]|nr:glycyl-radical enzyme activating protein [Bacillota bacterium]
MTGTVFNIERYHYTDGEGIRTLVFLKGCTLRCPWCCNPESQLASPQLAFNKNKCVNCGRCIPACPSHAIFIEDGEVVMDREKCTNCGACVERCFYDARILFGREMTVDELMQEIMKDMDYYARSKGGVTFSGGEPAMQPEFVRECVRRCRREYIDTAIETAGAIPWEMLYTAAEQIDEILFDIKTLDDETFRAFTAYSVEHVLGNLKRLCEAGKKVRIRCPIVPGVNKNEDFIRQVIRIAKENGIKRIDLLPFHQLGSYKYRAVGLDYSLGGLKTMRNEEVAGYADMIRGEGLDCAIGG